jgi:tetratricopeptide (TPR) repeat protein
MAKIFMLEGDLNKAKKQLQIVLKNDSNNAEALYQRGVLAQKTGQPEQASDYFLKSLQTNPVNNLVQMELINGLLEQKRYRSALTYINKFLEVSPNSIDLLERKAWLFATCPDGNLRNGNAALELAQRLSVRRKNSLSETMRNGVVLAAAYAELNQFEKALDVCSQYLNLAKRQQSDYYIKRMQKLIKTFNSRKPYRM